MPPQRWNPCTCPASTVSCPSHRQLSISFGGSPWGSPELWSPVLTHPQDASWDAGALRTCPLTRSLPEGTSYGTLTTREPLLR